MDVRAAIVAERRDLAALLRGLDDDQWRTPSLCDGWTVHDVVAHLVTPYVERPARTAVEMVRRRSVAQAMQAMVARVGERSSGELVEAFERHVGDVFVPPGAGVAAPLTDVIVHGSDIRMPLGVDAERPVERVVRSLDFVTSFRASPIFLPRRRLRGLQLVATDTDWRWGAGEPVRGAALDLLVATLGRPLPAGRLSGAGIATLGSRIGRELG